MLKTVNRRQFLKQTSLLAASVATAGASAAVTSKSPGEKILVGVIGCNGRGMNHIDGYLSLPDVEIAWVCDVDRRAMEKGIERVAKQQERKPRGAQDLRRLLDDHELDAVSIATPDHWHTPATVLACAAGKHVYVEKPGSHNFHESELIVAAARKHKRVVQMGNQRRSWPWVQEAIAALHGGEIGRVAFARGWYTNHRTSIGRGKRGPAPDWLDYDLWQGPAPEAPFRDNILHYNWHWFWTWGTGELGNNGVHALDLARWGLKVNLPRRVTCGGNRYHFPGQDDWETPDTMAATFDFGDRGIVWEGQSCDPRGFEDSSFGVTFYGEKGSMVISNNQCRCFDLSNRLLRETSARSAGLFSLDSLHFGNFLDGIRKGQPLNSEIEEGQKSTVMCHLGNIAWRSGRTVDLDPETRKIINAKAVEKFVSRQYRKGWQPQV